MNIRNRIQELCRKRASELKHHPHNWKNHTAEQRQAFRAVLDEIGFAGVALVYRSERLGGALTLIDCHMRQEEVGDDFELPCAITDLNDAEADKLLAIGDRLASMADPDPAKVEALLREIETDSQEIDALLAALAEEAGLQDSGEVELKTVNVQPPPKMAWVLIGIPTVRFGELAATVERIASIPETIVETTVSNG